jgi:hypothetical protein
MGGRAMAGYAENTEYRVQNTEYRMKQAIDDS